VAPWALTDADLERVDELSSLDEHVLTLLERLPVATRTALRGRVVEERSYEDLAAELQCSQAVVRQHVSRGLRQLRSRLEEI
jgi:RNA polymerase sigma factor (sigma-70 family)